MAEISPPRQGVRQAGPDHVPDLGLLGEGGGDGGVGDEGQVVPKDGAADNGAHGAGHGQQHGQNRHNGAVGGAAGRGDEGAGDEGDQRQKVGAEVQRGHEPGEALDQAALPQLLRQDARQQEREDDDAEGVVFNTVHHGGLKFRLAPGQQKSHAQRGKARHAEQHQGDLSRNGHYHHDG